MIEGKKILGIDPGALSSGYIFYDGVSNLDCGTVSNKRMILKIRQLPFDIAVIEMIVGFRDRGMANSTTESLVVIGQFMEAIRRRHKPFYRITRSNVIIHHFGKAGIKNRDVQVKKILKEKYPAEVVKPLSLDAWSAFALVTCVTENPDGFRQYSYTPKKRKKLTTEERLKVKVKFENQQINKAKKILEKYNPDLLK